MKNVLSKTFSGSLSYFFSGASPYAGITINSGDNGGYLNGYRSIRVSDIPFGSIDPEYTPEGDFLSNFQVNTSTSLLVIQFEDGGYAGVDDVVFRLNDSSQYTASWNASNNRYEMVADSYILGALESGKIAYLFIDAMLPQRSTLTEESGVVLSNVNGIVLTGVTV